MGSESTTTVEHVAAAWNWVLRLRDETVSEQDLAEWLSWYEADEAHKHAFEDAQMLWQGANRVLEGPNAPTMKQLLGESSHIDDSAPVTRQKSLMRWSLGFAAAAVIALIAITTVDFGGRWTNRVVIRDSTPAVAQAQPVQHSVLPDGSRVELAPKSSLVLHFTEHERALDLDGGEAYFAVARNRLRPFVVRVGNLRVRAVGTAFNIHKAGERIVVAVTDGAVEVSTPSGRADENVPLTAGKQATWMSTSSAPQVVPANAEQVLAWRQGRLEYLNEPLSSVIEDLNRYTRRHVVIGDPAVGRLVFSGTIFTESTDVWLKALTRVFPVQMQSDNRGDYVLVKSSDK